MRSLLPILAALACPIGMCLVPMLLARRKGRQSGCAMGQGDQRESLSDVGRKELHRLRTELESLRAERSEPSGDPREQRESSA